VIYKIDLPDDLMRKIKALASLQGLTLRQFVIKSLTSAAVIADPRNGPPSGLDDQTPGDQVARSAIRRTTAGCQTSPRRGL
jgi:hypothetical protein